MRTSISLLLAALLAAPAAAGAQSLAIAEASAITRGIEQAEVARVRGLFEEALRQSGIEVAPAGKKGAAAEYVTSLSLAKEGTDLVLTAQVSRLRLDAWAARAQARVQEVTPEAIAAAVQDLAGQIHLAVKTAPPRSAATPETRPPARKLRVEAAPAQADAAQ